MKSREADITLPYALCIDCAFFIRYLLSIQYASLTAMQQTVQMVSDHLPSFTVIFTVSSPVKPSSSFTTNLKTYEPTLNFDAVAMARSAFSIVGATSVLQRNTERIQHSMSWWPLQLCNKLP